MKQNINDLTIITDEPNFTIVLPVNCNMECSFCSWRTANQNIQDTNDSYFLKNLRIVLEELPEQFKQITISGGEPSLYTNLEQVMMFIGYHKFKNIKKVVFTTNGTNLKELSKNSWFTSVVDYVNISKHHYNDEENNEIFKGQLINWEEIKEISSELGNYGIPTNINCVLSDSIEKRYPNNFVPIFVNTARYNYINSITFRKDYDDGDNIHHLEKLLVKHKEDNHCPVCRKTHYIIDGMNIYFTSSVFEPNKILKNNLYEIILQPNGKLTMDWAGKNELSTMQVIKNIKMSSPVLREPVEPNIKKSLGGGCGPSISMNSGCK